MESIKSLVRSMLTNREEFGDYKTRMSKIEGNKKNTLTWNNTTQYHNAEITVKKYTNGLESILCEEIDITKKNNETDICISLEAGPVEQGDFSITQNGRRYVSSLDDARNTKFDKIYFADSSESFYITDTNGDGFVDENDTITYYEEDGTKREKSLKEFLA